MNIGFTYPDTYMQINLSLAFTAMWCSVSFKPNRTDLVLEDVDLDENQQLPKKEVRSATGYILALIEIFVVLPLAKPVPEHHSSHC